MYRIGGHVSSQGGLLKALERAKAIGANTIQLFGASPVQWKASLPKEDEARAFIETAKEMDIYPIFLHAPYLINLASPKKQLAAMSRDLLAKHLMIANAIQAQGVIFHIGSRGEQDEKDAGKIVCSALEKIFKQVPEGSLLIENSAGAGNLVGDSIEEIGDIVKKVDNERLGFCYDTAHGFESGVLVDFSKKSLDSFEKKVEKELGKDKLWVLHVNDSKTTAGSNKDRHENIGEGYIGKEGFQMMINHAFFKNLPFILEVPGFQGAGPDKKNIDILKSFISNKK